MAEEVGVLVVESRFGGKSLYLYISGRPRTRGRLLPGRLTLDLRTADGSVYRL